MTWNCWVFKEKKNTLLILGMVKTAIHHIHMNQAETKLPSILFALSNDDKSALRAASQKEESQRPWQHHYFSPFPIRPGLSWS
jgi:hypothetical protein